jgi:hypothetical protein
VATPVTGWQVARFRCQAVMAFGILSFSIAPSCAGWRIAQGATGAPVVPLLQTILASGQPCARSLAEEAYI